MTEEDREREGGVMGGMKTWFIEIYRREAATQPTGLATASKYRRQRYNAFVRALQSLTNQFSQSNFWPFYIRSNFTIDYLNEHRRGCEDNLWSYISMRGDWKNFVTQVDISVVIGWTRGGFWYLDGEDCVTLMRTILNVDNDFRYRQSHPNQSCSNP